LTGRALRRAAIPQVGAARHHQRFSVVVTRGKPKRDKREPTSDNEGDPARPHRYGPVSDDDGPLQRKMGGGWELTRRTASKTDMPEDAVE